MRLKPKSGDFSRATRFIWTRLLSHQITIFTPKHSSREYSRVLLTIARDGDRTVAIDLTACTSAELQSFRETVLIATEIAEPIVKALDAAVTENEDVDDSDDRLYRPLPTVVIRKGALKEYDEGLLEGRRAFLRGVQSQLLAGRTVRDGGSEVHQLEESDRVEAEDNTPEADESP